MRSYSPVVEVHWDSVVLESLGSKRCTRELAVVREALGELGYGGQLHAQRQLRQQLVSTGTRNCTPKHLMEAVREGYRSVTDGPFRMQECLVQ